MQNYYRQKKNSSRSICYITIKCVFLEEKARCRRKCLNSVFYDKKLGNPTLLTHPPHVAIPFVRMSPPLIRTIFQNPPCRAILGGPHSVEKFWSLGVIRKLTISQNYPPLQKNSPCKIFANKFVIASYNNFS